MKPPCMARVKRSDTGRAVVGMSRSQAPAAVVNLRAALVSYLKGSTLPGCDHDGEALVVDKGYRRWIA